jgi:tetratricopeptide (TPR) repeat protein
MGRVLLAVLLVLAIPARLASAGNRQAALDLVYEAADRIDTADAEQRAGRPDEAERLLSEAEQTLARAAKEEPALPRIGFERARVQLLRDRPEEAEAALIPALRLQMAWNEHVRMAELLDQARRAQDRPTLAEEWRSRRRLRGAGVSAVAAGLGLMAGGLALTYAAFDEGVREGVTPERLSRNRGGWGMAGAGAGIAVAGGAICVVAQIDLERLEAMLPGPWRVR